MNKIINRDDFGLEEKKSPVVVAVLVISAAFFFLIINLPESVLIWLGSIVDCSGEVSGLKRAVCYQGEPWVRVFFLVSPFFFLIGFVLFFVKLHFFGYEGFKRRRAASVLAGLWKNSMIANVVLLFCYWFVVGYLNDNLSFDIYGFSLIKNKVLFSIIFGAWHLVVMPIQVVLVSLEARLFFERYKK